MQFLQARQMRDHSTCGRARPQRRQEKESSASGEHRIEQAEIQTVISPLFSPADLPQPLRLPRPLPPSAGHDRGGSSQQPFGRPTEVETAGEYQRSITHDEFERLLRTVYCSHGVSEEFIRVDRDFACILMDRDAQTWFNASLCQGRAAAQGSATQLADRAISAAA